MHLVQLRTRDLRVDVLASLVINHGKGGAGVNDGSVGSSMERLAVDHVARGCHLPEAVRVVHVCVVGFAAGGLHCSFVDVAEGVEGCTFVWIVCVLHAAEIGSEELGRVR